MQKEEEKSRWFSQQSPDTQQLMRHLTYMTFEYVPRTPSSERSPIFTLMYVIFHLFVQLTPRGRKNPSRETEVPTMGKQYLLLWNMQTIFRQEFWASNSLRLPYIISKQFSWV